MSKRPRRTLVGQRMMSSTKDDTGDSSSSSLKKKSKANVSNDNDDEDKLNPKELAKMQQENDKIEQRVKQWLQSIVIGLNLCPFAEKPLRQDNLQIYVVRGQDDDTLLSSILVVLLWQEDQPGTSLIVCPECHPTDFDAYLDVLNMVEQGLLPDHDLTGVLQIAPFHPLFQFQGSDADSVDNWTNRAPYPMFHVLREDEVERAADSLDGDASRVWKRNVSLLEHLEQELGPDGVKRIFTNAATVKDKQSLEQILKEHRLTIKPSKRE